MIANSRVANILLLGGTGKVARRIAPLLSAAGYNVFLASRSGTTPDSLPNTRSVKFDWLDSTTYSNAFESGITYSGIFLIAPPFLNGSSLAKSFIDIAISQHVTRIVFLSGSVLHAGDGYILSEISAYIKATGLEYTLIRATWFMENFSEMHHMYTIKDENRIVSATGSRKIPWVSVEDIALVAEKALVGDELVGKELLVLGSELWGFDEIAKLLTEKLGREIQHVNVTEEELAKNMIAAGVEAAFARILAELDGVVRKGEEERFSEDLHAVLGRKGKSFRGYVDECLGEGIWD